MFTDNNFLDEFDLLTGQGNIGFYNQAIVTNIVLYKKSTNQYYNLFTRVLFEEDDYINLKREKGGSFDLGHDYKVCFGSCCLTIEETTTCLKTYVTCKSTNTEIFNGITVNTDRCIPRQYIPLNQGNRIVHALGINQPSYFLELFDEKKTIVSEIYSLLSSEKFQKINTIITEKTGIDFLLITDKAGGIVFQFPTTLLSLKIDYTTNYCGYSLGFTWHTNLKSTPLAFIRAQAKIEDVYTGATIEEYNGNATQDIIIGNLDLSPQLFIHSKKTNLILASYDCGCDRPYNLTVSVDYNNHTRSFITETGTYTINIFKSDDNALQGSDYLSYINAHIYSNKKKWLEDRLSFKQYSNGQRTQALEDIRHLIKQNTSQAIYLWDPFLRAADILNTLYFSTGYNIELKAIGSINDTTKQIYGDNNISSQAIIANETTILSHVKNENFGLNIEFRIQHGTYGNRFHDRFLMFPGTINKGPKAYSLGTSINSLGKTHHILMEVPYPQAVIDSFMENWNKLSAPACLAYKYKY